MSIENSQVSKSRIRKSDKWRPTIFLYLVFMNFILLCLLFPTVAIYYFQHETKFQQSHMERMIKQMRISLEQHSSSIAHNLALSAGQAIAGFDFSFLNIMVEDVVKYDRQIVYCYLMDRDRKILVHNDSAKIGTILQDQTSSQIAIMRETAFLAKLIDETQPTTVKFFELTVYEGKNPLQILETIVPVYSGANLVGFLRCGFSLRNLHDGIAEIREEWAGKILRLKVTFISITLFFFLLGGIVAILFTRTFVRSVRYLSDGVDRVARGDLAHTIQQKGLVCSEFTQLSSSFNLMTEKLRSSYEQLEMYSRNLEQKVVERTRELREAQAELLQQAHEAGMAEMAVGILHNIGNAITPAKVSSALLLKKIRNSTVKNNIEEILQNIQKMLKDPDSFSSEERDRYMKILALLPETITDEYNHINNEIQLIWDKHEHIESIIHLQLRYARLTGDSEEINVNNIVNDALEMLEDTIRNYSVQVEENLADIPVIRIEQPKLLQVMINLIKNGLEAMANVEEDQRRLVISTYVLGEDQGYLVISVDDTGIGFDAETKKKLFTYGFTTKISGSGFGLHSCANFLIAHNGTIEAHSDGVGKGAKFNIYLPLSHKEKVIEEENG